MIVKKGDFKTYFRKILKMNLKVKDFRNLKTAYLNIARMPLENRFSI
jgi:hypothetical protein